MAGHDNAIEDNVRWEVSAGEKYVFQHGLKTLIHKHYEPNPKT